MIRVPSCIKLQMMKIAMVGTFVFFHGVIPLEWLLKIYTGGFESLATFIGLGIGIGSLVYSFMLLSYESYLEQIATLKELEELRKKNSSK